MNIVVHTDGGARGNPGPAAVGIVIEISNIKYQISKSEDKEKKEVIEFSRLIGEATNNVAEYRAVITALEKVRDLTRAATDEQKERVSVQFYLDSTLVVNQLNGKFKVKEPILREFLMRIRLLEQEVGGSVHYVFIPREQNQRADFLVNSALDGGGWRSSC